MSVYTTPTLVRGIIDVDVSIDLTPFIDAAEALVGEVCATVLLADGVTPRYDSTRLRLIATWLSAHFLCIMEPRAQRERIAVLTFEAQSKVGLCLDVTHYGQNAKLLDTAGGLATLDARMKSGKAALSIVARATWLGTKACELPVVEVC